MQIKVPSFAISLVVKGCGPFFDLCFDDFVVQKERVGGFGKVGCVMYCVL